MKNIIFSLSFILFSLTLCAQENTSSLTTNQTEEKSSKATEFISTNIHPKITSIEIDKVCYGELSKVAFYEALLSQNDFNINLKNSTDLAIKSTEEIISKKRDQVLYSEED